MIQKIDRKTIFERFPYLAYSIGSLQYHEKEYWLLESENDEELTDMVAYFEQVCDCDLVDDALADNYVGETVISSPEKNQIETFLQDFTEKLNHLCQKTNIQKFYFLLEYKEDWFKQHNSFTPVETSLKQLQKILQNTPYTEALEVPVVDFASFLPIIFWISRCNASLPQIWLCPDNEDFIANFCDKGNLHLHFYSTPQQKKYKQLCQEIGLAILSPEKEFDRFTQDGVVEGRVLDIV